MAKALSISPKFCSRVRGIDSANHEIGCPPEVYATAYRFLRGFRSVEYQRSDLLLKAPPHLLSATYHVGEDFLDIASALRAIDEAVVYLELRRGDRIGHALGLGVEPDDHYRTKGQHVLVRKQDRLDDIVWLLYRSRELGVHMDPHLYGKLRREAEVLLQYIYGDCIKEENLHVSLTEYHCSMQLRADDPELYRCGEYRRIHLLSEQYDEFMMAVDREELDAYRKSSALTKLYYYYSYGKKEKVKGNEVEDIEITQDYVSLIRSVQHALQCELECRGIVIECNPSSNVLIGTFDEYTAHPIFRFHNSHLETDPNRLRSSAQLHVCINTDDLGIFDTSLEFEYALLYNALSQSHFEDGTKRYREVEILQYLEHLRCLSASAVFRKASE